MHKKFNAFTLVELIVVITILAILGTIGFVSLQGYSVNARDSVRIADTKTFLKTLNIYQTKNGEVPLPDDMTTITGSGVVFSYQGTLSGSVITELGQGQVPVDPLLKTPYLYATNEGRTKVQLLSYHEKNTTSLELQNTPTYAEATYADMFPKVIGDEIGILLNMDASPIQESAIELYEQSDPLMVIFEDQDTAIYSGYALYAFISAKSLSLSGIQCPEGYVPVPGNPEFGTSDFCVAQYEMSYEFADAPDTIRGGDDWNTVNYIEAAKPVSLEGKYPIALLTQSQAISACQSLGNGYHLIQNNEWMTIARSIEANKNNWSSSEIGTGHLYNGVSHINFLGCHREGGNIEPRSWGAKTGPGDDPECNKKRSHTLNNGSVIWDFSGNVWEHVNKANTLGGSDYNIGRVSVSGSSNGTDFDDDGIYAEEDMRRYGSFLGLGNDYGMGNVYYSNGVNSNVFLRGGSAQLTVYTGIYTIYLYYSDSGLSKSVGFRCAYSE